MPSLMTSQQASLRPAGASRKSARARGASHPDHHPVPQGEAVLDAPWEDLLACYQSLRRELSRVLEEHSMLLSDYRALRVLEEGPVTLGEIARRLGLAPATLTTLARGLERHRWTDLVQSRTDRRSILLKMTRRGRQALRYARHDYRVRLRTLESSLPPGARARVEGALRELRWGLEQAEGGAQRGKPRLT